MDDSGVGEADIALFLLSGFAFIVGLVLWYGSFWSIWPPGRARHGRRWLALLPILSAAAIAGGMLRWADPEVRDSWLYFGLYLLLGMAWVPVWLAATVRCLGVYVGPDVVERDNRAALRVVAGAYAGQTAVYVGANAGEGPGSWCVLAAAGLGSLLLLAAAMVAGWLAHAAERVTVERDQAFGARFGGLLAACGVLAGRAVAGDWESWGGLFADTVEAWPLPVLVAAALLLERWLAGLHGPAEPGVHRASGPAFPGLLYMAAAAAFASGLLAPAPSGPWFPDDPPAVVPEPADPAAAGADGPWPVEAPGPEAASGFEREQGAGPADL